MQHNARVKRTFDTAERKYMPTDIVDAETLDKWPQHNVKALIGAGFIELIEVHGEPDADSDTLRQQITAQGERIHELEAMVAARDEQLAVSDAGRIAELEALLLQNDLLFDPNVHMTKGGQPLKTNSGTYRRKPGRKT